MGSICIKPRTSVTPIRGMPVVKPDPWDHPEEITRAQLLQLRNQFWQNAPNTGGVAGIWHELRRATEAPVETAQDIIDRAGITPLVGDLRVCLDDSGRRYDLPLYVLSEPRNLLDA